MHSVAVDRGALRLKNLDPAGLAVPAYEPRFAC